MNRPVRITPAILADEHEQQRQEPGAAPGHPWMISGIIIGAFALIMTAYLLGRGRAQAASGPLCTPAATYLSTISRLELKGKWDEAASTAEAALTDPLLCAGDKPILAQKMVAAGLENLFSQQFEPLDVLAQQQQVDRFISLKQQARGYSVPFPSNLQVATRAYEGGDHLLAKTAFEEAYRAGEFTAADRTLLKQYISTLYNLGHWWAQASGRTQQEGLTFLVTSHALALSYNTGQGEAWGELHRLLGDDERSWPAPAATPLLPMKHSQLLHSGGRYVAST